MADPSRRRPTSGAKPPSPPRGAASGNKPPKAGSPWGKTGRPGAPWTNKPGHQGGKPGSGIPGLGGVPAAARPPQTPPAAIKPGAARPATTRPEPAALNINPEDLEPPPAIAKLLIEHWPERADSLARSFGKYIHILLDANRYQNLTGDKDPALQWTRHIEDSLRVAALLEARLGAPKPGCRILEVGAGGGAPGIVFAILWPRAEVTLMDSVDKKARFLESAAKLLGLSKMKVAHARSEYAAHDIMMREKFDWVVSRALAALPVLAELTVPFVKWSGEAIAIKGPRIEEELAASQRAYELMGIPLPPAILPYTRSDGATANVLIHHKVGMTPSPYPRRPEVIREKPL